MNTELMKQRRKELKLRQQDLADICGVSKNTIYNYENGRTIPDTEHLDKLAEILDVSVVELATNMTSGDLVDYNDTLSILEKNFYDKLVSWFKDRYKFNSSVDLDYNVLANNVLSLLKEILDENIIYSPTIDKVIFFNLEKSKNQVKSCSFNIIELYLHTYIGSIEAIERVSKKTISMSTFIDLMCCERNSAKPVHSGAEV